MFQSTLRHVFLTNSGSRCSSSTLASSSASEDLTEVGYVEEEVRSAFVNVVMVVRGNEDQEHDGGERHTGQRAGGRACW